MVFWDISIIRNKTRMLHPVYLSVHCTSSRVYPCDKYNLLVYNVLRRKSAELGLEKKINIYFLKKTFEMVIYVIWRAMYYKKKITFCVVCPYSANSMVVKGWEIFQLTLELSIYFWERTINIRKCMAANSLGTICFLIYKNIRKKIEISCAFMMWDYDFQGTCTSLWSEGWWMNSVISCMLMLIKEIYNWGRHLRLLVSWNMSCFSLGRRCTIVNSHIVYGFWFHVWLSYFALFLYLLSVPCMVICCLMFLYTIKCD